MKKHIRLAISFMLIIAMLLPLVSSVGAADSEERVSAGPIQTTSDLPVMYINSSADLGNTIYKSKDNKVDATAKITGAEDSGHNLSTSNIELKTRGNSTWGGPKWPYQIKFESKVDLFGMGKAKKWILLANYNDGTFVRNKIVFDIGKEIGVPYVVESVFVNLYVKGEYRGVYQLCEKVELGSSRVDIDSDYGVLLEMDAANQTERFDDEIYFNTSTTGKPIVYKEYNTDFEDPAEAEMTATVRSYTENFINTLEAELYSPDADWETIESMIDVDSFIRYYFISEITMEVDATYSSTYFYLDGPGDVLHCGPLWDYDRIMGWAVGYDQSTNLDYLKNITDSTNKYAVEWFKMLFRHPEFVQRANEMYDEVIRDAFNTEKIVKMTREYQEILMPSLVETNKLYPIFHNNNYWVEDLMSGTTEEKIAFTTNEMIKWLTARNEFLETAYGKYHPTLMYNTYDSALGKQPAYSGGSMTYATANITGIKMSLENSLLDGSIEYAVSGGSKTSDFISAGKTAQLDSGATITGIAVRLTGNLANYFSIEYRVFAGDRWTSWKTDGERAGGTVGNTVQRVQARLIQKKDVELATISFASEVGEIPQAVSAIVGNKVELPSINAEGYTFKGWFDNAEFEGEPVTNLTASSDTTLYAKLSFTTIGDVYDDDGDGLINSKDVFRAKVLAKRLVTATEREKAAGDLDKNGEVDSIDLFYIKLRVLKGKWTIDID